MFWHEVGNLLKRFVVIYGFTMLATWVICRFFNQEAMLSVDFLGDMIWFSACADAVSLVYVSNHELTEREWWIRAGIQLVLLEIVLMTVGYHLGMWGGVLGAVIFFVTILLVDIGVHLTSYGQDLIIAKDLNQRLRERREERKQV